MVGLEGRCQGKEGGGQPANHHLPPPPGSCVSSTSPLESSGHDPEWAESCRWSPSLSRPCSGVEGKQEPSMKAPHAHKLRDVD